MTVWWTILAVSLLAFVGLLIFWWGYDTGYYADRARMEDFENTQYGDKTEV